jgi:predicted ATP-grasp superfamily ATP-dependent carboligase
LLQNPAIVLDLGVNGLGVIRSLGRKGVSVTGVTYVEHGVAPYSRYCEVADLPDFEAGQAEVLTHLLALCKGMPAPPVLFPTSDESTELLSRYEEELASSALFVLPARQTLLDILNKNRTARIANECGMRIPATHIAASFADLCDMAPRMRYPILYKPHNHYSVSLPGRAKNFVFDQPDDLKKFFGTHPHLASQGVFQEIIRGGDGHILVCTAYFDRNSEPLAVYTGRKIRQLQPDYGVTSYGISEDLPEIAEMTICFLRKIGYRGLAAVEYVEDRATGQVYFIEINGRSYYHNALFLSCGVNLPWIAYLDAVRHPMLAREARPRQKYGRAWLDFARDARSFRLKHKAGQLGWGPWLGSLCRARSFAVFAFDDPGPFLHGMTKLIWRQVRKGARRVWPHRRRRLIVPSGLSGGEA